MDKVTGQTESFFINIDPDSFDFSISKHFIGLEWHNKIGNTPYPIKYKVEISNLAYGINDDSSDVQSVACFPYNKLLPDETPLQNLPPVSQTVTVQKGTAVEWINNDLVSYTLVSGKPEDKNNGTLFDTGKILPPPAPILLNRQL